MNLVCIAKSDVGKKREHNEDAYTIDVELGLFAVADGMGGHACGEVASQEALLSVSETLADNEQQIVQASTVPSQANADKVLRLLERAVRTAAYQVFALGQVDPDRKGMGTTLSVLLLRPEAAYLAHVGDSRIYIMRQDHIKQLTHDHTFVAEMVRRGRMTEQEARRSRFANMLVRAVGPHDFVDVDTRVFRYQVGDMFLLCSDGLSGYVTNDQTLVELVRPDDMPGSVERLVGLALDGGGHDNITVVLVRVDP